jgi:hypothetical protein
MDKNNVQIVVKCTKELRENFNACSKNQDSNASREIRAFMRDYIKRHGQKTLEL